MEEIRITFKEIINNSISAHQKAKSEERPEAESPKMGIRAKFSN